MKLLHEQKCKLFIDVYNAMRECNSDEVRKLFKNVDPEDQVWVLTARSSYFPGYIAFIAQLYSDAIPALFENLPENLLDEVLRPMEDGNTSITELVSWGNAKALEAILKGKSLETVNQLLSHRDHNGRRCDEIAKGSCAEIIKKYTKNRQPDVVLPEPSSFMPLHNNKKRKRVSSLTKLQESALDFINKGNVQNVDLDAYSKQKRSCRK